MANGAAKRHLLDCRGHLLLADFEFATPVIIRARIAVANRSALLPSTLSGLRRSRSLAATSSLRGPWRTSREAQTSAHYVKHA